MKPKEIKLQRQLGKTSKVEIMENYIKYSVSDCDDQELEITKVFVSPEQRGKGFGKKLVQEAIDYAKENGFKAICLTNHLWDESVESVGIWHPEQRFDFITKVLPLPQDENVKFLFGAEAEMDYNFTLGISEEHLDFFDFITVSTTHLHLEGYTVKTRPQKPEEAAELWLKRFEQLLKKDLPWHKTGVSHLTGRHIFKADHPKAVSLLKTNDLYNIFSECAKKGIGIELNMKSIFNSDEEKEILLRPFFIAKECGCKFYLGSDAHKTEALKGAKENFLNIVDLLDLKEEDKFKLVK